MLFLSAIDVLLFLFRKSRGGCHFEDHLKALSYFAWGKNKRKSIKFRLFFGQFSANSTQLELPVFEFFLEFWLEFFQDFAWVLSFFMSFWEHLKKCRFFSKFGNYLMIKRLFLGLPLSFPPKNWVFIQFSTNSTQLELPVSEFFRNFAWVFFRIFLEFWVFLGLSFFRNVQKKKPA